MVDLGFGLLFPCFGKMKMSIVIYVQLPDIGIPTYFIFNEQLLGIPISLPRAVEEVMYWTGITYMFATVHILITIYIIQVPSCASVSTYSLFLQFNMFFRI